MFSSSLDFLKECKAVIAGNSSILLEAALSGASPVYYRFDEEGMEDYYGFCKKGLARDAKDIIQLKQYIGDAKLTPKQIEAVKYYSATFETEWEGKEFELVGDLLVKFI